MLSDNEKKVIASIQGDIPVTERPYKTLAEAAGMTENVFLETLRALSEKAIIRRFGATLRHQKSGFTANAMIAWKADENRIQEIGYKMAECEAVSHCYRRNPAPEWPFNLYTMIHAKSGDECRDIAARLSEKTGVREYRLLFSKKELKKTSMKYFNKIL